MQTTVEKHETEDSLFIERTTDLSPHDFDYIRYTWVDINGIGRSRVVPGPQVEKTNRQGFGVYAGSLAFGPQSQPVNLPEVEHTHGNAQILPCQNTLHPVTWAGAQEHRVGEYFCDTLWQDGTPQEASPRFLARQQCRKLKDIGYQLMSGFELEFTLMTAEGSPAWKDNAIFSPFSLSKLDPLLYNIERAARAAGVRIEGLQTEHGLGQCEFILSPRFGLQSVDDCFILKEAVKDLSSREGLTCTFMAKPFAEEAGNSAHFNHSLWDTSTRTNVFHDPSSPDGLSLLARHWLAGLIHHAGALTALCCPTVNCYRRLHGRWAPSDSKWGIDNRRSTFRAKNISQHDTYIENRIPSSSCNPYIVLAATLAAGLDGIDRQLQCPPSMDPGAKSLPTSLEEALKALEDDLVMTKALGGKFVQWFVRSKTEIDPGKLGQSFQALKPEVALEKERAMYAGTS